MRASSNLRGYSVVKEGFFFSLLMREQSLAPPRSIFFPVLSLFVGVLFGQTRLRTFFSRTFSVNRLFLTFRTQTRRNRFSPLSASFLLLSCESLPFSFFPFHFKRRTRETPERAYLLSPNPGGSLCYPHLLTPKTEEVVLGSGFFPFLCFVTGFYITPLLYNIAVSSWSPTPFSSAVSFLCFAR